MTLSNFVDHNDHASNSQRFMNDIIIMNLQAEPYSLLDNVPVTNCFNPIGHWNIASFWESLIIFLISLMLFLAKYIVLVLH